MVQFNPSPVSVLLHTLRTVQNKTLYKVTCHLDNDALSSFKDNGKLSVEETERIDSED